MSEDASAGQPERDGVLARMAWPVPWPVPGIAPDRGNVVALNTDAVSALQGLALQRAFRRIRDPLTRMRIVQRVTAIADGEQP